MNGTRMVESKKPRLHPAPPKNFDPFSATKQDMLRHGVPLRPDSHAQPGLAALWDRLATRYRSFEHLEPKPDTTTAGKKAIVVNVPLLGPDPTESCGYQLFSSAPITSLFVTWTVPDLQYTSSELGTDYFHTFVGLGFLDLHVEMTVNSAENVTCQVWAEAIGNINLPVRPGRRDQRLLVPGDQRGRYSSVLPRQRDHRANDKLLGRYRISSRRDDQCRGHSYLAARAAVSPIGEVWGGLFRRNQRLFNGWYAVAYIRRRDHHGWPKRRDSRQPGQAHRLRLQSSVRRGLIARLRSRAGPVKCTEACSLHEPHAISLGQNVWHPTRLHSVGHSGQTVEETECW